MYQYTLQRPRAFSDILQTVHVSHSSDFLSVHLLLFVFFSSPASCISQPKLSRTLFAGYKRSTSHSSHACLRLSPPTYPPQLLNHEPRSQHRLHARPSFLTRVVHHRPTSDRSTVHSIHSKAHLYTSHDRSLRAHVHYHNDRRILLLHSSDASYIVCTSFSTWHCVKACLAGVHVCRWDVVGGFCAGVGCWG
jgi:hypothetical protein